MKLQLLFVLLFFSLMGCTWDNQDSTGSLKVNFVHTFQDTTLQILESNQLIYTTTTGNKFNIKNLKYYISINIKVIKHHDLKKLTERLHFMKLSDESLCSQFDDL